MTNNKLSVMFENAIIKSSKSSCFVQLFFSLEKLLWGVESMDNGYS